MTRVPGYQTSRRHAHVNRRGLARGFTLVEMVVSLVVVGILIVGMSSAMVLASKALPHANNPAGATVESAQALHQFRDDLRAATELLNRNATSVTLHLPDRDGDGWPEIITYAWSGKAGDPLTRTASRQTAVTVLDNVQSFSLDYTVGSQGTVFPGHHVTSDEIELASRDAGDGTSSFQIKDDDIIGFRFTPTLPSDATAWHVNRVLVRSSKSGANNGQATFELTGWTSGGPDGTVVDSTDVPETDLDMGTGWAQVDFTDGGPFTSGDTAAVSISDTGDGTAANINCSTSGTPPNTHESNDGGATWTVQDTAGAMDHYVYGTYDIAGDDWTFTKSWVETVQIGFVHGDAEAITHELIVPLSNAPEAATAVWEADFNAAPTALDYQHDGAADWQNDGDFDTADLADGAWEATDAMRSAPDGVALDTPFTVDLWAQDTVDNGDAGGFRVRFDRDGGEQAFVTVQIDLQASGQVVSVHAQDAGGDQVEWVMQTEPAGEAVHVALAVDPSNDTVGVMIAGQVVGSFAYEMINSGNQDMFRPFVDGGSSGVWIEHLRLSVGGTATITPGAY